MRGMSKTSKTRSGTIAAILLLSACALGGNSPPHTIDDARLARLPAEERAQLVDQQHPVDVAQSNLETVKVAQRDAEQFLNIVETEHSAATQRMAAAKKSVELNQRTGGNTGVGNDDAQRELAMAGQRLDAASAKLQYARNLVDLRKAQVELRKAELDLANADIQLARYDRLKAHDQSSDLRREDFVAEHDKAQAAVNERRNGVEARRGTVQASQHAWTEMHKKFDVAAHTPGSDAPIDAPAPPQPID
jgi:colicin import membrane protein